MTYSNSYNIINQNNEEANHEEEIVVFLCSFGFYNNILVWQFVRNICRDWRVYGFVWLQYCTATTIRSNLA